MNDRFSITAQDVDDATAGSRDGGGSHAEARPLPSPGAALPGASAPACEPPASGPRPSGSATFDGPAPRSATEHPKQLAACYEQLATVYPGRVERWTPDGRRTYVNPAVCAVERCSADELIGTPVWRMVDPAARVVLQQDLRRLTPAQPEVHRHYHREGAGESSVTESWVDCGLFDPEGRLIEVHSIERPVAHRDGAAADEEQRREFLVLTEALTRREREVMALVCGGKANKVIARQLQLSVKTVEKHRSSMMRKLKVQSVAELVRRAVVADLPDLETDDLT